MINAGWRLPASSFRLPAARLGSRGELAREKRAAKRLAEGDDVLLTSSEEGDKIWRKRMRKEEEEDSLAAFYDVSSQHKVEVLTE